MVSKGNYPNMVLFQVSGLLSFAQTYTIYMIIIIIPYHFKIWVPGMLLECPREVTGGNTFLDLIAKQEDLDRLGAEKNWGLVQVPVKFSYVDDFWYITQTFYCFANLFGYTYVTFQIIYFWPMFGWGFQCTFRFSGMGWKLQFRLDTQFILDSSNSMPTMAKLCGLLTDQANICRFFCVLTKRWFCAV